MSKPTCPYCGSENISRGYISDDDSRGGNCHDCGAQSAYEIEVTSAAAREQQRELYEAAKSDISASRDLAAAYRIKADRTEADNARLTADPVINRGTGSYPETNREVRFKLKRYAGMFLSVIRSEKGPWLRGRTRDADIYCHSDECSYRYNDYVYSWEYVEVSTGGRID